MRRWTAIAATVLLVLEAGASLLVALVLGGAANHQHMKLAGLSTSAVANGAYGGLGFQAGFLLLLAAVLVRAAIRGARGTGRPTRILVIAGAVFHGVFAAVLLALSGVPAFAVAAVTLTLLVLFLFSSNGEPSQPSPAEGPSLPAPRPGSPEPSGEPAAPAA